MLRSSYILVKRPPDDLYRTNSDNNTRTPASASSPTTERYNYQQQMMLFNRRTRRASYLYLPNCSYSIVCLDLVFSQFFGFSAFRGRWHIIRFGSLPMLCAHVVLPAVPQKKETKFIVWHKLFPDLQKPQALGSVVGDAPAPACTIHNSQRFSCIPV